MTLASVQLSTIWFLGASTSCQEQAEDPEPQRYRTDLATRLPLTAF